jgi:small subunit ribosomal protein S19
MSRVKWKGPYIQKNIIKSILVKKNINKELKTCSRKSIITPKFVGLNFLIYNGKSFLKLKISEEMIGHKLGEFSPTRKQFTFKKKNKWDKK